MRVLRDHLRRIAGVVDENFLRSDDNVNGMTMYLDGINWTIAGRKVELIKEDDQFNPQVGLQKAKKLVESDNVDMLTGLQASNVALAVLNYAKQQKAFYIVSGAGTDAITWDRYPYLFRTSISTYQLSTPMADYIYDHLGKEIVTTSSDYAGGRDVMAQFKGPYLKRGGKVLKEIWPPLGTQDFSPYLTDIKSINPPVTYDFMPGADAVRFIQQYSEFGLKEKMPLTDFTITAWVKVNAFATWARVFDFGTGTTNYMFLAPQYDAAAANAARPRFAIRIAAGTEQTLSSSIALTAGASSPANPEALPSWSMSG